MARTGFRPVPEESVAAVRRFHRFCARRFGALDEGLPGAGLGPTGARVLSAIAAGEGAAAVDLVRVLELDPGYLSRVLRDFEGRGLLRRLPSPSDRRRRSLLPTARGRALLDELDRRASEEVAAMLSGIEGAGLDRLLAAMDAVRRTLGDRGSPPARRIALRRHRPGDIGWAVERHGSLYRREHGWDGTFEALVAGILGQFAAGHDPRRERAWIAEVDGRRAGCVFLVRESRAVARLRCLLVEPEARGLGLGSRLVEACVAFAAERGYRRLVLWTASDLESAGRIYGRAGFRKVSEKRERRFGKRLLFEEWERPLRTPRPTGSPPRPAGRTGAAPG